MKEIKIGLGALCFIVCLVLVAIVWETVPTGNTAVGLRFSKVTGETLSEGLHVVNPLMDWEYYDCLEKEYTFEDVQVPAIDQMKATMDITVKGRFLPEHAVSQRRETGTQAKVIATHFIPAARGAFREGGRGVQDVELYFEDTTVQLYQSNVLAILQERLAPKGYDITEVIVRDVELPKVIRDAITKKKERQQQIEQERAELERVSLNAQQKVRQAQADLSADSLGAIARMIKTVKAAHAELTADSLKAVGVRIRADAEAHAILVVKKNLTGNFLTYTQIQQWDGVLPRFTGNAVPLMDMTAMAK